MRVSFVAVVAVIAAAAFSVWALSASSPALAQFACTTTPSNINCTNSGTAAGVFDNTAAGTNQNATTTNAGTAAGFTSRTNGGGNATVSNSGSNAGDADALTLSGGNASATNSGSNAGGLTAETVSGGNATVNNSGRNTGIIAAETGSGGNAIVTNSGQSTGGIAALTLAGGDATVSNSGSNTLGIQAAVGGSGNATVNNSGRNTDSILAQTQGGGTATITNSGSNTGGMLALTVAGGSAAVSNSGSNSGGLSALAVAGGNATVTNAGSNSGGAVIAALSGNATMKNSGSNTGDIAIAANNGNATVINSGATTGNIGIAATLGNAILTNIVGGRVSGAIVLISPTGVNTINFQGGNWLFTITTQGPSTTFNTGGEPFVVSSVTTKGVTTSQIAVLDPTTFALADRSLTNFTGEISQLLQTRFGGMTLGTGGRALGFTGNSDSPVAAQAQAAFSGIPSVAMSYASNAHPVIGKAPAAAAPYYDTTIWASGFGGERKQRADGVVLPTTDIAFGGAMGVDRALGGNLRLGAFVGAGASREEVELSVQKIDATYVFGGVYGRFDWIAQFLDFSLYGGGISNKSTRGIANNTVAGGFETASASYGGWFINPEVTYGYRIPFNAITVTPRVRLRYVGGQLDGYSESGSMQSLTVGRRDINDLEERGEVELSTASGALKASATVGIIGLERLGNPTVNTVLLGQNLAFVTPGQKSAVGGVLGLGLQYRPMPNVSLFVAGEGTAMSDKSDSFAASGGARVSF